MITENFILYFRPLEHIKTLGKIIMSRKKIECEFIFRASPSILYTFLTTPACLVRWFCDGVDIQDDVYTFEWAGSEEMAELVDDIEEERVRFVWEEAPDEYLEFRMYKSKVTNETVFEITDFADEGDEKEQKTYWETNVEALRKETGG